MLCRRPINAGSGSQGPAPARSKAAGGTGAAPVPGMGHLSGDGLRLGHGPGFGVPWQGRAGLWGAGDWPGWDVAGTGAGGPRGLQWCPGLWAGWRGPGGGLEQTGLVVPEGHNTRHLMMSLFPVQSVSDILKQINIEQKCVTEVNLITSMNLKDIISFDSYLSSLYLDTWPWLHTCI